MRRTLLATTLLAAAFPAAQAADLTLHRVMLSAAGIGYFEYTAHADGPASLGLDIPLAQVDDVLRSLTVFDDHGGVGSIELPGHDDARQAFAGVPFAQAMLESPAALLTSLRGEEITVAGPDDMTGRLVSVVAEPLAAKPNADIDHPPATHTRITLLTEDGFRQFILEEAESVRPTDPALRARIAAALDAARAQAASSIRHLTLRSSGDTARTLDVGYVVAAPLWKASYRVILPQSGQDQARVQGWAVLENQSGQDWKNVDLTLHSGNPVTFHQAIYASYYADRPEVPVEVLGRILPDADSGEAVVVRQQGLLLRNPRRGAPAPMAPPPPPAVPAGFAKASMAPPAAPTQTAETVLDTIFHVATPIDLAAGHTASVPILDQTMKAEQLDWLQPGSTRPVTAIRLTNTGSASLPPGVLTLYTTDAASGTAFAGDARLSGLPAGETRLLGFAEDLRTHVMRTGAFQPHTMERITAAHGVLHRTVRSRMVYGVDLTAPPHDSRRVLVEFAKQPDSDFSVEGGGGAAREETGTAWRVTVTLKPGETAHLKANVDTTQMSELALLNDGDFDDTVIAAVMADGTLDAASMGKLQPLLTLRDALAGKQAALHRLTDEQTSVTADEERVRNNLRVVTGPGGLHDRLLAALDGDETRLGALRAAIERAQGDVDAAHAALADAAEKLEI
jgi:hypothetical protein